MKQKRIKVRPEHINSLVDDASKQFGSCCRSSVFDALAFRTFSAKASFIREAATNRYGGVTVIEEKFV